MVASKKPARRGGGRVLIGHKGLCSIASKQAEDKVGAANTRDGSSGVWWSGVRVSFDRGTKRPCSLQMSLLRRSEILV